MRLLLGVPVWLLEDVAVALLVGVGEAVGVTPVVPFNAMRFPPNDPT